MDSRVIVSQNKMPGSADFQALCTNLLHSSFAFLSEIVAGALQDHKRAVIMGKNSFGKGSSKDLNELIISSSI